MCSKVSTATTCKIWRITQIPTCYNVSFGQYTRFLSQWLGTIIGVSAKQIMLIDGSHSGRSGGASAAAPANVPIQRWGQHMGSVSRSSQFNYMQLSSSWLLSVSLPTMRDPDNFLDERISNSNPTVDQTATSYNQHVQFGVGNETTRPQLSL
jgi:hypothetical protein